MLATGMDGSDPNAVHFEVVMPDATRADYVLCDRHGRSLAVIEAKRFSVNPADAAEQAELRQAVGRAGMFSSPTVAKCCSGSGSAKPLPAVKTFFKQDGKDGVLPPANCGVIR